jgi:hypothetical protein
MYPARLARMKYRSDETEAAAVTIPRVRFTVRRMMVAVAAVALALGVASFLARLFGTRYAEGFSEGRFTGLRVGMSEQQVEATLGPPLEKVPWQDGRVNWVYSEQPCGLSYQMRWVLMRDGKIDSVLSQYWQECLAR